MNKTFIVLYRPNSHDGVKNYANLVFNYEIEEPEEGFGNNTEGKVLAGFKAKLIKTNQYRNFRFDRLVALVPK